MEIVHLAQVALLAAGAVTVAHEILKLKLVPLAFANRYPVPTNIILSVIAALIVKWQDLATLHSFGQWAAFIGLVAVIAAVTYNQLIGKSEELKSIEGEK